MSENDILDLFNEDKILVRAMETPKLYKNGNGCLGYDFTVWAEEVDCAIHDLLSCASSTLLIAGEKIPTYKNIGFIINSEKAEIIHVSEMDSGSGGDTRNGDFIATQTDLCSLSDLAAKTRKEKLQDMNEVNISIKDDAILGLFVNKAASEIPLAQILLAQKYYQLHTKKELPIFQYDSNKGNLTPVLMNENEKNDLLLRMKQSKKIRSLTISYDLDTDYTLERQELDLEEQFKQNKIDGLRKKISNSSLKNTSKDEASESMLPPSRLSVDIVSLAKFDHMH